MKAKTLPEWVAEHRAEIRTWAPIATDCDPGCLVAACDRDHFAVGLCKAHYRRAQRAHRADLKRGPANEPHRPTADGSAPTRPGCTCICEQYP